MQSRLLLCALMAVTAGCSGSKKSPPVPTVDAATTTPPGSGGSGGSSGTGGAPSPTGGAQGGSGPPPAADSGSTGGSPASDGPSGTGGQTPPPPTTAFNVLASGYDDARTGTNTSETILTTSNVNPAMFGLKFSMPIGGKMYGQPLYVSQLTVNGAKHNVVYAATAHNTVHAFDADDGTQLWMKALEPPVPIGGGGLTVSCQDMSTEVGITSTPVISLEENKIYVVAKTSGKQLLHALDLTTGTDGPGSPAVVGNPGFPANSHLNRPGLLLLKGVIYIAFGSHCDDGGYHGWMFGHNARTLMLESTYNTTPSGKQGAIWQSGMAPSTDGTSIFLTVGNGTSDAMNMGFNVVKLTPAAAALNVASHFLDTTSTGGDNDLAAGPVLVGDQMVSGGKAGDVMINSTADTTLKQRVQAGGEVHILSVWTGSAGTMVYTWPRHQALHAWSLAGGMLTEKGTNGIQQPAQFGGIVAVSSNAAMPGTGVLWAAVPTGTASRSGGTPGVLYAFDATDVTKAPLWSSDMDPKDTLGGNAKFSPPTVANGKVYAATFTGKLMVYGLK
jgi:outer membrane protein assembly factor BamB